MKLTEEYILKLTGKNDLKKVTKLVVDDPSIDDISILSSIPNLKSLCLSNTSVEDITSLSFCKKLLEVDLRQSKIIDLKPISELKSLKVLAVPYTISDVTIFHNLLERGLVIYVEEPPYDKSNKVCISTDQSTTIH